MDINRTLVEAKYAHSSVSSAYFSFKKCSIYTHSANAKFLALIETKQITVNLPLCFWCFIDLILYTITTYTIKCEQEQKYVLRREYLS